MITFLLALAVVAYFAPELLSGLGLGAVGAWEFVLYGAEAAALWGLAFVTLRGLAVRCVCAWGMFEALQRPVCRLAFPMDRKPQIPEGQTLCDAAFQLPMSGLSVVLALCLAALVQEVQRGRT